jgi:ubiquinone/menaquinone biosynthesis C-methylase UbiE
MPETDQIALKRASGYKILGDHAEMPKNVPKADYSKIADQYDSGRPILEHNLHRWLDLISESVGSHYNTVELLDLGCGTGRFSIPIAKRLGYSVVGADLAVEMINIARKKSGSEGIQWKKENAEALSFADESFDVIFMSHLLDHIKDPLQALRECHRVLRYGGVILNRYRSIDDLKKDPEHIFFSGATKKDEARGMKRSEDIETHMAKAGFRHVMSEVIVQQTYNTPWERLRTDKFKARSILSLLDEMSFAKGMLALKDHIDKNPRDPWLLIDVFTLTSAKKL